MRGAAREVMENDRIRNSTVVEEMRYGMREVGEEVSDVLEKSRGFCNGNITRGNCGSV